MRYLKLSLLAVVAVALAACASSGTNAAAQSNQTATLIVDNRAILDMNMYALRSSQRIRLGTATGLTTSRFTIPASLILGVTSLRFQADPIGSSRAPISEEINVSAGDEIQLMIPPN
jgi:hypothetical protein